MNIILTTFLLALAVAGGVAALAGIVWLVILLAGVPGRVADHRGLESADRIRLMGYIGLVLPPLWIVALCWSLMEGPPADTHLPGLRPLGRLQSTTPIPPAAQRRGS